MVGPGYVVGLEESYMTYEVTTDTQLPTYGAHHVSARRRFSDFVSLARLLPKLHPGSFLPARPDKASGSGSADQASTGRAPRPQMC
jgi:hypothetical protein